MILIYNLVVFFIIMLLPYEADSGFFGLSVVDYSPFKEGREWKYSVVDKIGDSIVEKKEVTCTVLASIKMNGKDVIPIKSYDEQNKIYNLVFHYVDSTNAIWVAVQSAKDAEPKMVNHIYIKAPINEGASWESKGIIFTIISINDTVTVPAGTFNNCLKIKWSLKDGEMINWYAPDIGVIKLYYKTRINKQETTKEEIMQLVSFKK